MSLGCYYPKLLRQSRREGVHNVALDPSSSIWQSIITLIVQVQIIIII